MSDRSQRRKFGQNYLIDPVILFEIEQAINPQKNNLFFEIGPGTGALTEKLMSQNIHIIAMDIDKKNIDLLGQKYDSSKHQFIHGNILKESLNFLSSKKHRIVGNLPYNISTQIILKLVKYFNAIEDMHFLVQKEVAHRICASNGSGDWGRLGVKISAFFQSEILFDVPSNTQLKSKFDEIKESIISIGFENTALNYSKADSSKFGGRLGWIEENFLNAKIRENINKINIGEITKPVVTPGGFLILLLEDIKYEKTKKDVDKELDILIRKEKNSQLNQFSNIYFKKIRKNIKINEI